jgi:hypothetical protein
MAATSYKIRGIEPPDLAGYAEETRKLFWSWVVDFGLKAKAREVIAGLDKHGNPMRIKDVTRKHRKSAMTPSGKGDPNAPALVPGWQKSRTYSLLAGRALPTHAEFYWRFDPFTGDSWGVVLAHLAKKGCDTIGLSAAGVAKVKAQSWARWASWKAGTYRPPAAQVAQRQREAAVPRVGRYSMEHATLGVSASGAPVSAATFATGRWTGGMTGPEWAAYFRQTASAKPPGRPARPSERSPVSGPGYNRIVRATWGQGPRSGGPGAAAPGAPRPGPRIPMPPAPKRTFPPTPPPRSGAPSPVKAPKPAPKPVINTMPRPGYFQSHSELHDWAKATFPNAAFSDAGIPLENWNHLAVELDRLATDFPFIAKRLKEINSGPSRFVDKLKDARALADYGLGEILAFNPTYWSQPLVKLTELQTAGSTSGWTVKGITEPNYAATHEWGHLMEAWLRAVNPQKRAALQSVFEYDGQYSPSRGGLVSRYARTSENEAFAEAFAAMRRQPVEKQQIAKKFAKVFNQ